MSAKPSIDSIFCSAIEIESPDERRALVEQACGEDVDLKQQVERLLHAHFHGRSILDAPVQPVATIDEPLTKTAGTVIGPYKLIEQIGEGGMGTVWMAQQTEPVKRVVAVKLIKAGMDSKQVIARFEAERQALALMDHPNIARVLDAGTTDAGRPYFVMDLVKGVPITRYCDEHHLTPRQRLELFLPVCSAVQHAHQKGIIHRDLKPSNGLVALYDGKPVPKVIDFGVAKAAGQQLTDKTLVTGFGNLVGTLEYMSPEQAEVNQLDIDTRSDIYSLGVLLYELLAGSPPFSRKELEKAGMLEMLRLIREQEPSKPSMKLSTAEGLPTLAANRGTEPAKLTKLVRGELDWIVMKALEKDRSRRYETANGFAMDVQRYLSDETVLACPPSAGYRLRKFARRNKRVLVTAALLGLALLVAVGAVGGSLGWVARDREARQSRVGAQVDVILAEVDRLEGEQKWPEALAAARRAEAVVTGGEADAETAQRVRQRVKELQFIDRLERIRIQGARFVDGKFDPAGLVRDYGRAFRDYGVDVEALPVEASIDRLKTRPALAIQLAAMLDGWAYARRSGPDAGDWKRLVAVARGIDPDPLRNRLRATWIPPVSEVQDELLRLAESIDVRAQHPETVVILAFTLRLVKQSDSALRLLRDAQFATPGDFLLNWELGRALLGQKDLEGAIRFFTAAVSIRPNSDGALNNLGNARRQQKKLDEAIACLRKAIELDPKNIGAYDNLGIALYDQKKLDEAICHHRKAIELDPNYAAAYSNLGLALRQQKKLDEAIRYFRKAIELDPNHATMHHNLGLALYDQKKLDEAIRHCRTAIELDPKHAGAHITLGNALRAQKQLDEASHHFRKAIEIDPKCSLAYSNLGGLLCDDLRDYDKAIECCRTAIELDPKNAHAYSNLGVALRQQGKLDEAIDAYHKAIELDPKQATAYFGLGNALRELKKLPEAIGALRTAIELDPKHAGAHNNLGALLCGHLKEYDKGIECFRTAIELDPNDASANKNLSVALAEKGWNLINCSDPKLRDPKRALEAVQEAVERGPRLQETWGYFGWIQYRMGNWRATIEALEKSCKLHKLGRGNAGQWIVLALAHARLAAQERLPEKERARHQAESRRWFDQADKEIDSRWRVRPVHWFWQAIWDFREEARELMKKESEVRNQESGKEPSDS